MRSPAAEPVHDEITTWALKARGGDGQATAAFVRATQHHVRRFVIHLIDAADADDLTQEVYVRAMRALPAFAGKSTAMTWLLSIARRACVDYIRTVARGPRIADLGEWQQRAEREMLCAQGGEFDADVAIADLLGRLTPECREAFVATQITGLSYAEAAEVCGCPIGTVRSRIARAREDLIEAVTEPSVGRLRPTS